MPRNTPEPPTTPTTAGHITGGAGQPARDGTHEPSRAVHICICGQPITDDLWDMTIFASATAVAYVICLFETD